VKGLTNGRSVNFLRLMLLYPENTFAKEAFLRSLVKGVSQMQMDIYGASYSNSLNSDYLQFHIISIVSFTISGSMTI